MMEDMSVGLVIKLNRKYQQYSVRTIAKMSGVDFSYLAKIERGQIIAHESVIASILRELKLTDEELYKYDKQVAATFDLIYSYLVYQIKDAKPLIDELVSIEGHLQRSLRYIDFVLVYYIYQITNGITDPKQTEIEGFLNENITFLVSKHQAMFYDYLGLRCYCDSDIQQAIIYLEKARIINSDCMVQAMIAYHLGMVLASKNDLIASLESYRKAKVLFDEDGNMIRSFYCQMAMTNVYSSLGKNKKAITMAEHLLVTSEQLVLKNEDKALLLSNLSWFYLLDENYNAAVYTNELALQFEVSIVNCFYFVWSCYKLNNKAKCFFWIEKSKTIRAKIDFDCVELNLIFEIEKWVDGDINEENLLYLLNEAKVENSKKMVGFILKILMEFYQGINQIEKLNRIQSEYIELLN